MSITKFRKDNLYITPSGVLAVINNVNIKRNRLLFFRLDEYKNDVMDLDLADKIMEPVFKSKDVANILGKSPTTLRVYEHKGLLKPAKRYKMTPESKVERRYYTKRDVEDLIYFFKRRHGPGRRDKYPNIGMINEPIANQTLKNMYESRKGKDG